MSNKRHVQKNGKVNDINTIKWYETATTFPTKKKKRTKKWIFYHPTKKETYTQIKKHQIEEAV